MFISKILKEALKDESEDTIREIGRMVFEITRGLKNLNGKKRISLAHEMMDQEVYLGLRNNPNKAACQKGCSHCCYMGVDILDDEAILMADMIKDGQVEIDQNEFEKQKNMDSDDFKKNPRPCIFLKESECQIYESRPLACRKYYVMGNIQDCVIQSGLSKTVKILFLPRGEIVYSAMLNVTPSKKNATLAHMINKELCRSRDSRSDLDIAEQALEPPTTN